MSSSWRTACGPSAPRDRGPPRSWRRLRPRLRAAAALPRAAPPPYTRPSAFGSKPSTLDYERASTNSFPLPGPRRHPQYEGVPVGLGMRSAYCQRAGAAHDGMPYVERGAGERHAGPHEVIAGRRVGRKRAQLGQGGEIASWEPRRKGNKEDAARPGCGSGREAATTRGEAAWSSGLRRAWGNGRSTCDALRRGMRKVCLDDRFGEPEAILHGRFPGTGRPAEALCTQPVTSVEGRSALRTPTFAKRPSWVTYSESKLDPSRSVPGLGTNPPDFYGDETWKSQTVLTLSTHPALVINVAGVRFPRCLPESKTASGHLRRGSLSSPYTFLSAGYPSETSSVAPLRFSMRGAQVHRAHLRGAPVGPRATCPTSPSACELAAARTRWSCTDIRRTSTKMPMPVVFAPVSRPNLVFGASRPQNLTPQPGNSHTTAAWDEGRIAPTEPGTCTPRHHRH